METKEKNQIIGGKHCEKAYYIYTWTTENTRTYAHPIKKGNNVEREEKKQILEEKVLGENNVGQKKNYY